MNTLFTSVGRRVELLRAFRKAYADLGLDGKVVAVDIDPLAPALQEADSVHLVRRIDDPEYLPALLEACRSDDVSLIVPLVDRDIPLLAEHRTELERTGARVLLVADEAVEITRDKLRTDAFFRGLGVATPATWSAEAAREDRLEFPVVVKPRFGSAGEHVMVVRDRTELDLFLRSVPSPIVQEWLPGPEITTDVFCDFDGGVLAVVSRERIEVRWGEVAKGVTVHDPEILERSVTIAEGLGAIGPITVQCMRRDGDAMFTEINPRFGGGVPLGIAAGVPSPRWLLELAAGRRVDAPPLGTYRAGLYLTRFDESFFLEEEDRVRVERRRL